MFQYIFVLSVLFIVFIVLSYRVYKRVGKQDMSMERYKKKMAKLGYITVSCTCGLTDYKATVSHRYCSWCGKKINHGEL